MTLRLEIHNRPALASALVVICFCVSCADVTKQKSSLANMENQIHDGNDEESVRMLFPTAPGSIFRLGTRNPNSSSNFQIEKMTTASRHVESGIQFWRISAHDLKYASGGFGKTSRLHIYAGGARQLYTWKTQTGFLSSPADIRNQEFTAFARVQGISDPKRAAISLKIRGGAHSEKNPDWASCAMLTFQAATTGAVARFGKELVHPIYDYVRLTPRFDSALVEGRWVGLKLVSYSSPREAGHVVNRLYLDTDPFNPATGKPRNEWKLFAEFIDVEGASTGRYTKLVNWGGWQTTLRTDGVDRLDFTLISLRAIVPPSP